MTLDFLRFISCKKSLILLSNLFMNDIEKEQEMIKAAAAKAAQRIVQPKAAEIDATGEFPENVMDAFGKQGFLSIILLKSMAEMMQTSPLSASS